MTLHVIALVVLGLMCGSELNVAAFAHPTLNRLPLESHILLRSAWARLFGRVMPFWMAGSTLLNLLLLLPFAQSDGSRMATRCHCVCYPGAGRRVFARRSRANQ